MRDSLITRVTVIFLIAFALVCILFATFSKMQANKEFDKLQSIQLNSINYLLELYNKETPPKNILSYFKAYNLIPIYSKKRVSNILINGKLLLKQKTPLGEFFSIKYKDKLFMYLKNESFGIVFENTGIKNLNDPIWIAFFLTIILLTSLYLSMIRSISPLKKLSKNIQKFGAGNLEIINLNITEDNEIAKVSKEFNQAATKIQELITSRQLFLRTIMHELKTPIAKGRIVSEMIDDELAKDRLISVFARLEILINEFAKVEQLITKNYNLKLENFKISLILEQALDIMMLDNYSRIKMCIDEDALIFVDFDLFSLAIKNLIDNALKYSTDKFVYINCDKKGIYIKNKGNPFKLSIENLKEAFVRNEQERVNGMGLGLYIIDTIVKLHGFELNYFYEDGYHNFCIDFKGKVDE